MNPTLEVYYDYVSPFAYMASRLLPDLALRHGAEIAWRPVELASLSSFDGGLPYSPSKREYVFVDAARTARFHGIEIGMPDPFPVDSTLALRLAVAAVDTATFAGLHEALFRAAWVESRNLADRDELAAVAAAGGRSEAETLELVDDSRWADRVAEATAAADRSGIFGVPTVVYDGEMFWGVDAFPVLEWTLAGRPARR